VTFGALGFAFAGGLLNIYERWSTEEEYSHGFIIPLVSVYILWQKRAYLSTLPLRPGPWGLLLVILGLAALFVGELAALFILIQYALVVVLLGLVWTFAGTRVTRAVAVPVLFLLFAVPLPWFIDSDLSGELQLISSQLGVGVIRLFDVPVYLQGNVIDLGTYQLQVAEACSGLRYLYPLMSFGFICVYLWKAPLWKKVVAFASTIPITIFLNSLRIGIIGFLVDNFGISHAEGFLHFFEGWIIFMTCVAILLIEMAVLAQIGAPSPVSTMIDPPSPPEQSKSTVQHQSPPWPFVLSSVLVIGAAISMGVLPSRTESVPERNSFTSFSLQTNEWQARRVRIPEVLLSGFEAVRLSPC
jgi:exosortase D (VPLPA-CTERM-specific)